MPPWDGPQTWRLRKIDALRRERDELRRKIADHHARSSRLASAYKGRDDPPR
jgi:hypothetical protein